MKYAVMSDVHSNPHALEAALADARSLGCEKFAMLGDVTGYGYDGPGAMALVRRSFGVALMGNHDSACAGLESELEVRCNPNYRTDRMQREEFGAEDLDWLRGLPYTHREEGLGAEFAHGNFRDPKSWDYVFTAQDAAMSMRSCGARLMFCGHTHTAGVWERGEDGTTEASPGFRDRLFGSPEEADDMAEVKLRDGVRYLVNVGSVGYPRNDYCTTYGIWDVEAGTVGIRRLPFDFAGYVKRMVWKGAPIPEWLGALMRMMADDARRRG